jgi:hypothetical protein
MVELFCPGPVYGVEVVAMNVKYPLLFALDAILLTDELLDANIVVFKG